jgi:hypothetical protein
MPRTAAPLSLVHSRLDRLALPRTRAARVLLGSVTRLARTEWHSHLEFRQLTLTKFEFYFLINISNHL